MEERKYTVPDELRLNSHQQLEKILQHNKDGSYSTQSARADILHQFINDMHQAGYKDFELLSYQPETALSMCRPPTFNNSKSL